MTYPMTVIDTSLRRWPARSRIAPSPGTTPISWWQTARISPADGKLFIVGVGPLGGGWGAKSSEDGVSVTVCINDGDTHNGPTNSSRRSTRCW